MTQQISNIIAELTKSTRKATIFFVVKTDWWENELDTLIDEWGGEEEIADSQEWFTARAKGVEVLEDYSSDDDKKYNFVVQGSSNALVKFLQKYASNFLSAHFIINYMK